MPRLRNIECTINVNGRPLLEIDSLGTEPDMGYPKDIITKTVYVQAILGQNFSLEYTAHKGANAGLKECDLIYFLITLDGNDIRRIVRIKNGKFRGTRTLDEIIYPEYGTWKARAFRFSKLYVTSNQNAQGQVDTAKLKDFGEIRVVVRRMHHVGYCSEKWTGDRWEGQDNSTLVGTREKDPPQRVG